MWCEGVEGVLYLVVELVEYVIGYVDWILCYEVDVDVFGVD